MNKWLIILLLFLSINSQAQTDSLFKLVIQHKGNFTDFTVDNLGNVFLLYQNGQLKKIRPNGDSLAVFNNVRRFGKLHSIDVSNPLKTLLYYKDFGTTVILDRFLNQRAVLDFRKLNLLQIRAIGQAYDNNIWIFDELESKLKKISDDGRIVDQSTDFRLVFDAIPAPDYIIDHDKFVYLYDPLKGVYIYDYYGGFQNTIPLIGWNDFNVINNTLFGRNKEYLFRYDKGSLELRQIPVPPFMNDAQKIIIGAGFVYLLKQGSILIYSYN